MNRDNAVAIVKQLRDQKASETLALETRIADLAAELEQDPWEGTAAQLTRLKLRLIHSRLEVEALTILLEDK